MAGLRVYLVTIRGNILLQTASVPRPLNEKAGSDLGMRLASMNFLVGSLVLLLIKINVHRSSLSRPIKSMTVWCPDGTGSSRQLQVLSIMISTFKLAMIIVNA